MYNLLDACYIPCKCITYMPTVLEFARLSCKFDHCPSVPETMEKFLQFLLHAYLLSVPEFLGLSWKM